MIYKISNEYNEAGRLVDRSIECDMSVNEWQWIELVVGAVGALIAILIIVL